jgi:hypothetical protein
VDGEDAQGNGVQVREIASHAVSVKHKRVAVFGQIGPELLELLRNGLVVRRQRRMNPTSEGVWCL